MLSNMSPPLRRQPFYIHAKVQGLEHLNLYKLLFELQFTMGNSETWTPELIYTNFKIDQIF